LSAVAATDDGGDDDDDSFDFSFSSGACSPARSESPLPSSDASPQRRSPGQEVEGIVAAEAAGDSSPPVSPGTLAAIAAVADLKEFEREQREDAARQARSQRERESGGDAAAS